MKRGWIEHLDELHAFERVKFEKDGLDIFHDLPKYQRLGFDAIPLKERDLLKWSGIYIQRPKTDGYFMMRVKIPSGMMNSEQAWVLARLANQFARGNVDITTREAIQFHWLTVENIPDVLNALYEVGLDTTEACGDCPRTILGNPLAGIDPDETMDTTGIVQEVFHYFQNNREFSNLPRKFKISISANVYNAAHAQINDLAFTPAIKKIAGKDVYGFHVYVGGGLSAKPHLAQMLDLFVQPDEVLKVAIGVACLFRDYGNRKNRQQARLKFLVADWGKEKFQAELLKLTGPMETAGTDLTKGWNAGYFHGVHPQKQQGLYYVGLSIPGGRLSGDDLWEIARCADEYGDGSLRTTNTKDLLLINIPEEKLESLLEEEVIKRFMPNVHSFASYMVTCTGREFCNFALVDTKNTAMKIAEYLDKHLKPETPLRIHMNACLHACGQHPIADIGLKGAVGKMNGQTFEKFEISVGGTLRDKPRFGISLQGLIPAERVHEVIRQFAELYQEKRNPEETFADFVSRIGTEAFQDLLDKEISRFEEENRIEYSETAK